MRLFDIAVTIAIYSVIAVAIYLERHRSENPETKARRKFFEKRK